MPFNKYIRDKVQKSLQIRKKEFGYFMIQSTKPQTIGYSFADSPVGFLAWIYEKLVKASDDYPWTDDEGARYIIRSVRNPAAYPWSCSVGVGIDILACTRGSCCVGTYLLRVDARGRVLRPVFGHVVDFCSPRRCTFPRRAHLTSQVVRILRSPSYPRARLHTSDRRWAHMIGQVVQESFHEKGGHFAAFEAPEALAGDLRKMYGKGGPAYGVVPGKDGY